MVNQALYARVRPSGGGGPPWGVVVARRASGNYLGGLVVIPGRRRIRTSGH
jgi:hypothetical protein